MPSPTARRRSPIALSVALLIALGLPVGVALAGLATEHRVQELTDARYRAALDATLSVLPGLADDLSSGAGGSAADLATSGNDPARGSFFLLDRRAQVIRHPVLAAGTSLAPFPFARRMIATGSGSLVHDDEEGVALWCTYRPLDPSGAIAGWVVPDAERRAPARRVRALWSGLVVIAAGAALLVLRAVRHESGTRRGAAERAAAPTSSPSNDTASHEPSGVHPGALALASEHAVGDRDENALPTPPPSAVSAPDSEVQQRSRMEAVGSLAAGVAHDFNNLLATIRGNADLLLLDLPDDEQDPVTVELREYAESILQATARGAKLTAQLLAYSRKPGPARRIDCHALITDVLDSAARTLGPRIELRRQLAASEVWILGEEGALRNALVHLALNARDAMDGSGALTFSTRDAVLPPAAEAGDGGGRPAIQIEVRDDGRGMDAATRRRMFDPFFTTKGAGQGTGLGLAAVHGTLVGHGGDVEVESEPGSGTAFRLRLPLAPSEAPTALAASLATGESSPPSAVAGVPVRSPEKGCVLVVDDEPVVLQVAESLLTRLGYEVFTARGGDRALELFLANPDAVDVVLVDAVLSNRSGREVVATMRERRPDLPVVLISGSEAALSDAFADRAEGAVVIGKPFGMDELALALRQARRASGTRRDGP